ncbi:cytochrome c [Aquibium sp. LZ166]|uniref:Cytochrome c n=1 Tax=Aquibium pacificus TaxID=3153579 RepID=A0ABV3SMV7_9HYPH
MKTFLLAVTTFTLVSGASFADPHEDRVALMKSFGQQLGQLAPMAKGEKPFDAAATAAALTELQARTEKFDAAVLFPEGSTGGDKNRALPVIWTAWDDFTARADKLKADVAEVAATPPADQAALGAALGKIGSNCGGCHEVYRAPEG